MIEKLYRFTCNDCAGKDAPTVEEYSSKEEAQAHGWAIAHGEKNCYCPACAFKHRNTGCKGAKNKKKNINVKQLEISEVRNSA